MASTASCLLFSLLLLLAAAPGSEALCTEEEMTSIFQCIVPYNDQFYQAIPVSDPTCNRTLITEPLCRSFRQIVTCVKGKTLSAKTCVPNAASQTNSGIEIPCKIEDFFAVCKNVPPLWNLGTTPQPQTTDSPTKRDDNNGSGAAGATQSQWMTSLMTIFICLVLGAGN